MKTWHVLILSLAIVVGCGSIATVIGTKDRYHYTAYTVFNLPTRVDTYTGAVEVFDKNYGGWTEAANWKTR